MMSTIGYENRAHVMKTYQKCWQYQCSNPECAVVGFVNDVVIEHRYSNGVPCPRCGEEMTKIREAAEGEYDSDAQEVFAQLVRPVKIKIAPWWPQEENERSDKDFITEEDLAKRWGVPVSAIRTLVREKKLRCIQIKKGKRVFTEELIDDFFRRAAGLSARRGLMGPNALVPGPNRNMMSIEESRKLLNEMFKKPEP